MSSISRRNAMAALLAGLLGLASGAWAGGPLVTVYKSPTCGCCGKWVEHLRQAGLQVEVRETGNLDAVKQQLGVPRKLGSCHTATVGGYIIEGHVPAAQVQRLLREKPPVAGIAVPGMPVGSPGMEGPGGKPYQVVSWRKGGTVEMVSVEQPHAQ